MVGDGNMACVCVTVNILTNRWLQILNKMSDNVLLC